MISRRLLRILAVKALYQYEIDGDTPAAAQRTLTFSINKSYELYLQMLQLFVDVADEVKVILNQRKNKLKPSPADLNPSMRVPENRVAAQLKASETFANLKEKNAISWSDHSEVIRKMALTLLETDYYAKYIESEDNYENDKNFVIEFYSNAIEDFAMIHEALEEMSPYWSDTVEYFTSFTIKTIRGFKESMCSQGGQDLPIMPPVKDKSDSEFVKKLLEAALKNKERYMGYVEEVTQNWDPQRIALMDKVIIILGIAEMETFDSIPVKVTLDEYIEIAKYYSTKSSNTYVNGMLDKIASMLRRENVISKE